MQFAKRMEQFADGIFTELLAMKTQQEKAGHTVIDLSVGTPNIPPVERIRRALADAALDPKNYVLRDSRHIGPAKGGGRVVQAPLRRRARPGNAD